MTDPKTTGDPPAADDSSPDQPRSSAPVRVAFVCVRNAGRSQMAHAFAERAREARGAEERIEFVTGGTEPTDRVHDVVVEAMAEVGVDLSRRTPREITTEDVELCDVVITTGCSAEDVCPATWTGEGRDWDVADPHGKDLDEVRAIRDEIEGRVDGLFTELEVGARV